MIRYRALKHLEKQGVISDLKVHPTFNFDFPVLGVFKIKGEKRETRVRFIPDFTYKKNGKLVVEDVKSPITANEKYFRLKKGLFEFLHKTKVQIV